jgi:hypothetical protein
MSPPELYEAQYETSVIYTLDEKTGVKMLNEYELGRNIG